MKPIISGQEFPPEGQTWCIVMEEDVTPLEDDSGLVKISVQNINLDEKTARVGIFNSPDMKTDSFVVSLEDMLPPQVL